MTGIKRAWLYAQVKAGLLPRPVSIGGRSRAWPDVELEAINRARVAGKTDAEIKALVKQLEAARS
ncbi:MAG TPA: AlpA family phage regulatory protein, partial [Burkholderiales bacterium]